MKSGISAAVSERALRIHNEHLESLKLKYSVLEKSCPELRGKTLREIMKFKTKYRAEAINLKSDIMLHELYFSSFGEAYQRSDCVRKSFGSEANFLYELFEFCKSQNNGYALIYLNRGKIAFTGGSCEQLCVMKNQHLCVDLCEHAYFLDYGFEREEYLKNLLPYLDISRIDKFYNTKD